MQCYTVPAFNLCMLSFLNTIFIFWWSQSRILPHQSMRRELIKLIGRTKLKNVKLTVIGLGWRLRVIIPFTVVPSSVTLLASDVFATTFARWASSSRETEVPTFGRALADELPEDEIDASDELEDPFSEEFTVFCGNCSCNLRAWFCSFSQLTLALCSANNSSKAFRLPLTARLSDRAWVLQVNERVHCFWRSAIHTPQCLSASNSRSTIRVGRFIRE